jgi:hypothetical protein
VYAMCETNSYGIFSSVNDKPVVDAGKMIIRTDMHILYIRSGTLERESQLNARTPNGTERRKRGFDSEIVLHVGRCSPASRPQYSIPDRLGKSPRFVTKNQI